MKEISVKTTFNEFNRRVKSSDGIYISMLDFLKYNYDGINYKELHPSQAHKIIELSFLNLISGWEEFVENIFVRYLVGASSLSNYSPILRIGKCNTINHAYELLSLSYGFTPEKNRLNLGNTKEIIKKAKILFESGKPFSKISENQLAVLQDCYIIRNRIAHSSRKCNDSFKNLALKYLNIKNGKLPPGFSVGKLLSSKNINGISDLLKCDDYYQSFSVFFREIAELLVN
jgi:hypothetical protein